MAITTYSELKTAVGNWLDRSDLSSRIPEFIALAEARINRRLRVRPQEASTTLTPSSGSASLPSDYLGWKRVRWNGTPYRDLKNVSPSFLTEYNPNATSGDPIYFAIEGSTLKVAPVSDTTLDFLYVQKVPALSDSATTNWLLTAHPDGYLWASLAMASTFTEDPTTGPVWNNLANEFLGDLWASDFMSGNQLVQRVVTQTP